MAVLVPTAVSEDCLRVAVDGVDGAGKTTFADALAALLRERLREVVRVSVDDFHQVRAIRYQRGRESAEGFWLDAFDYPRLRADVLDPLGPAGPRRFRRAAHDVISDAELCPPDQLRPCAPSRCRDREFRSTPADPDQAVMIDRIAPGGSQFGAAAQLCGDWHHEPPCRLAPHHTAIDRIMPSGWCRSEQV